MSARLDPAKVIPWDGPALTGRLREDLIIPCPAGARADEFERWLAAPVRVRSNLASHLYADCRAWSAAVERRAKQRQLLLGGLEKYHLLPGRFGASLVRLNDALAALGFRVEVTFERLGRRLLERWKHDALQHMGQGQVLGHHGLKRLIEGHPSLSCVSWPGEEAESGSGVSPAPATPEAGQ